MHVVDEIQAVMRTRLALVTKTKLGSFLGIMEVTISKIWKQPSESGHKFNRCSQVSAVYGVTRLLLLLCCFLYQRIHGSGIGVGGPSRVANPRSRGYDPFSVPLCHDFINTVKQALQNGMF